MRTCDWTLPSPQMNAQQFVISKREKKNLKKCKKVKQRLTILEKHIFFLEYSPQFLFFFENLFVTGNVLFSSYSEYWMRWAFGKSDIRLSAMKIRGTKYFLLDDDGIICHDDESDVWVVFSSVESLADNANESISVMRSFFLLSYFSTRHSCHHHFLFKVWSLLPIRRFYF